MALRKLVIGCGYLGLRVARRWLAQGDSVAALTRSEAHANLFRDAGIEPVIGDVTQPTSLAGLPEVDTLLYAVGLDRNSGQSQRDVYVGGLDNVLGHMAGRVRRLLYISSTSVYGQNSGEWVEESSEARPESENGRVCLDAENVLRDRVSDANILRLAGIYGPGRLVARIESLRAGLVPEGNPEAWLNLIHVEDAVAAVVACERQDTPSSTYLICDDSPCRRREFYSLLAWMIGAPQPRFESPSPAGLHKRCSNRRLHEELQVVLRFPGFNIGLPHALTTPIADRHLSGAVGKREQRRER
jgi:nucleoside-diphosphate-sugar epimerase